jgi:hypothetical protein
MKDCCPAVVFMRARYAVAHVRTEDCVAPKAVSNASVNVYRQVFAVFALSQTFIADIGRSADGAPTSTADVEFKHAVTPLQANDCIRVVPVPVDCFQYGSIKAVNVHSVEMALTLVTGTLYGGVPAICALITFVKSITLETVQYSDARATTSCTTINTHLRKFSILH